MHGAREKVRDFNCPPGYKGTYLPALKKSRQTDRGTPRTKTGKL